MHWADRPSFSPALSPSRASILRQGDSTPQHPDLSTASEISTAQPRRPTNSPPRRKICSEASNRPSPPRRSCAPPRQRRPSPSSAPSRRPRHSTSPPSSSTPSIRCSKLLAILLRPILLCIKNLGWLHAIP
ncbi:hypothetical protein VTK56DRAFT_4205 [Thermocarpiscus australiensis]